MVASNEGRKFLKSVAVSTAYKAEKLSFRIFYGYTYRVWGLMTLKIDFTSKSMKSHQVDNPILDNFDKFILLSK